MRWTEFMEAAPEMARLGEERFENWGLVLLGTTRRDGTPRITPNEVLFLDGEMYLSMMWRSKKALDLMRDPRLVAHSVVDNRMNKWGDFKLRGTARLIEDADERERYAQALFAKIKWRPRDDKWHLFAIDIEDAAFIIFDDRGTMTARYWAPASGETTKIRPE
jgi:nitroimidazol reductase NimA-like FMN-containing flavoprotein (pyridoxamine 5'-phosphate oxidase superfamily)